MTVVRGDLTTEQVDAVVNAANGGLLGGGGVDGALLQAGGPRQLEGRRRLRERIGSLPTGEAAASTAGDLPAQHVIHVVGPVYGRGTAEQLASCYRNALRVADELGARTVAFPSVSTGVYGWLVADAAATAIGTLLSAETRVAEARMVLFDERTLAAYQAALVALEDARGRGA